MAVAVVAFAEGPRAWPSPQSIPMATPPGGSAIAWLAPAMVGGAAARPALTKAAVNRSWPAPPRVTLSVKRRHNGWHPESNCVGYLDRGHSAGAQAQVLIANVYHNVQRLGAATRSQIERELELGPASTSHSGRSHQDSRAKCAGGLLGVAPSTVSNTISNLRRRGVQPGRPRGRRRGAAITSNETNFIRVVSWLAEAGVDVGGGWHSASFCEGVEHAANAQLAHLVGLNLARPLPKMIKQTAAATTSDHAHHSC